MANLPELPEGYRWRLVKDFYLREPRLLLEKKIWRGWKTVSDSYIALNTWGDVNVAVEWAANRIITSRANAATAENHYGVIE